MIRTSPAFAACGRIATYILPRSSAARPWRRCGLFLACAAVLSVTFAPAMAEDTPPTAVAVADFHNLDTSGESSERSVAHAARVQGFSAMISANLASEDAFKIVPIACAPSRCSPDTLSPAEFLQTAHASGARLVIYGRIQKVSTLVQMGVVQALDLTTGELVLNQHITFRGDDDEAFQRAANFVSAYLKKLSFSP